MVWTSTLEELLIHLPILSGSQQLWRYLYAALKSFIWQVHIDMQWTYILCDVLYTIGICNGYFSTFADKRHKCCYRGCMSCFKCWWDCEKPQGSGFSLFKMMNCAYSWIFHVLFGIVSCIFIVVAVVIILLSVYCYFPTLKWNDFTLEKHFIEKIIS